MSQAAVQNLFSKGASIGVLSPKDLKGVDVEDLGAQIQEGLGALTPEDIQADHTTLVTFLVDDSSSIQLRNNAQLIREGHNMIVSALAGTAQKRGILMQCRYLNGKQLYPFVQVENAILMDDKNYRPNGSTPLYDQSIVALLAAEAKRDECLQGGVPSRCVTVALTDGADYRSSHRAQDVAAVVHKLIKSEAHIILAMGIFDGDVDRKGKEVPGTGTDFRKVFADMGIPDGTNGAPDWILTPGNTPSEVRRAFNMVSQKSQSASQGAQAFSKAAMGGFGA